MFLKQFFSNSAELSKLDSDKDALAAADFFSCSVKVASLKICVIAHYLALYSTMQKEDLKDLVWFLSLSYVIDRLLARCCYKEQW